MHKWRKEGEKWLITCPTNGRDFDPIIWIDKPENKGHCPFCNWDVEAELKKRQAEKRERQRLKEMSEELRKKNTLEAWL